MIDAEKAQELIEFHYANEKKATRRTNISLFIILASVISFILAAAYTTYVLSGTIESKRQKINELVKRDHDLRVAIKDLESKKKQLEKDNQELAVETERLTNLSAQQSDYIENQEETIEEVSKTTNSPKIKKLISNAKKNRSAQWHLNKGRELVREGNYTSAIEEYDRALEIDMDNKWLLADYVHAQLTMIEQEKPDDIHSALDSPIKKLNLAQKLNDAEEANSFFAGALFYNWGRVRELQGNAQRAVTAYEKSLELRPGNNATRNRLEQVKAQMKSATK